VARPVLVVNPTFLIKDVMTKPDSHAIGERPAADVE
jgi:hypothetical protein